MNLQPNINFVLNNQKKCWKKVIIQVVFAAFAINSLVPATFVYAHGQNATHSHEKSQLVTTSLAFTPALIRGVRVDEKNPFQLEFIVDSGDSGLADEDLSLESTRLVKYFLASLTTPEDDLWVNLSPYEKNRIVPKAFGQTEMGKDMLAQDYLLKQVTASLIYPENELGKEFWDKVYAQAYEQFGTTEIPVNTFNKVWILPKDVLVYESGLTAYVVDSNLKVMLEEDYVALKENQSQEHLGTDLLQEETSDDISDFSSQIVREVVLPVLEEEVNNGKNFARLRQIYHSLILATWFKKKLKDSILSKVYVDQNKVKGVDVKDKAVREKIYAQYLSTFKKGIYNLIKEDTDPVTQAKIERKYFAGGVKISVDKAMMVTTNPAVLKQAEFKPQGEIALLETRFDNVAPNIAAPVGESSVFGARRDAAAMSFSNKVKAIKKNPEAASYEIPDDTFRPGVSLEHYAFALGRLVSPNFPKKNLEKVLRHLKLIPEDESVPEFRDEQTALLNKLYTRMAEGFDATTINLINEGLNYEPPDLAAKIFSQSGGGKLQGPQETVSNADDALGGQKGQFGKGNKQNMAWLEPNGWDRIEVFTKSEQPQSQAYKLIVTIDNDGQWYIQTREISNEDFVKASGGRLTTHGTVHRVKVKDEIPIGDPELKEREITLRLINRAIHRRFAYGRKSLIKTKLDTGEAKREEKIVNGWKERRHVIPRDQSPPSEEERSNKQIQVNLSPHEIEVIDPGKGMTPEILLRMYVPNLGDKKSVKLTLEKDIRNEINTKLAVVHDRTDSKIKSGPTIAFARNEEVIHTLGIDPTINREALADGELMLEFGLLMSVQQARDRVTFTPDYDQKGVPLIQRAVVAMAQKILDTPTGSGEKQLTREDKVKYINTIVAGIEGLIAGNPANRFVVENSTKEIKRLLDESKILDELTQDNYVLLPHSEQFAQLDVPQGKKAFYLNEYLFNWDYKKAIEALGGKVIDHKVMRFVREVDGEEIRVTLAAAPFKQDVYGPYRKFQRRQLVSLTPKSLPHVKNESFIIVPQQYLKKFLKLVDKRLKGELRPARGESQDQKLLREFLTIAQEIKSSVDDTTITSYEVGRVRQTVQIPETIRVERNIDDKRLDAKEAAELLTKEPDFTKLVGASRVSFDRIEEEQEERVVFPDKAKMRHMVNKQGELVEIATGRRIERAKGKALKYGSIRPLGHDAYLVTYASGLKAIEKIEDGKSSIIKELSNYPLVVSPFGLYVVEDYSSTGEDRHSIVVWDSRAGKLRQVAPQEEGVTYSDIKFTAESRFIVYKKTKVDADSGQKNYHLEVYDLLKGKNRGSPFGSRNFSFEVDPKAPGLIRTEDRAGRVGFVDSYKTPPTEVSLGLVTVDYEYAITEPKGRFTIFADKSTSKIDLYLHSQHRMASEMIPAENMGKAGDVPISRIAVYTGKQALPGYEDYMAIIQTSKGFLGVKEDGTVESISSVDSVTFFESQQEFFSAGSIARIKHDTLDPISTVIENANEIYFHPQFDLLIDERDPNQRIAYDLETGTKMKITDQEIVDYEVFTNAAIGQVKHYAVTQRTDDTHMETHAFDPEGNYFSDQSYSFTGMPLKEHNAWVYRTVFGGWFYKEAGVDMPESISVDSNKFPDVTYDGQFIIFTNPDTHEAAYVNPNDLNDIRYAQVQRGGAAQPAELPKGLRQKVILNDKNELVDMASGKTIFQATKQDPHWETKKIIPLQNDYYALFAAPDEFPLNFKIVKIINGQITYHGPLKAEKNVRISPSGRYAYVQGRTGLISVFDTHKGKPVVIGEKRKSGVSYEALLTPDEKYVVYKEIDKSREGSPVYKLKTYNLRTGDREETALWDDFKLNADASSSHVIEIEFDNRETRHISLKELKSIGTNDAKILTDPNDNFTVFSDGKSLEVFLHEKNLMLRSNQTPEIPFKIASVVLGKWKKKEYQDILFVLFPDEWKVPVGVKKDGTTIEMSGDYHPPQSYTDAQRIYRTGGSYFIHGEESDIAQTTLEDLGKVRRHRDFSILIDESDAARPEVYDLSTGLEIRLNGRVIFHETKEDDSVVWTIDEDGVIWKQQFSAKEKLHFTGAVSDNKNHAFVFASNTEDPSKTNYYFINDRYPFGISTGIVKADFPQVTFDGQFFVFSNPKTGETAIVDPEKPRKRPFLPHKHRRAPTPRRHERVKLTFDPLPENAQQKIGVNPKNGSLVDLTDGKEFQGQVDPNKPAVTFSAIEALGNDHYRVRYKESLGKSDLEAIVEIKGKDFKNKTNVGIGEKIGRFAMVNGELAGFVMAYDIEKGDYLEIQKQDGPMYISRMTSDGRYIVYHKRRDVGDPQLPELVVYDLEARREIKRLDLRKVTALKHAQEYSFRLDPQAPDLVKLKATGPVEEDGTWVEREIYLDFLSETTIETQDNKLVHDPKGKFTVFNNQDVMQVMIHKSGQVISPQTDFEGKNILSVIFGDWKHDADSILFVVEIKDGAQYRFYGFNEDGQKIEFTDKDEVLSFLDFSQTVQRSGMHNFKADELNLNLPWEQVGQVYRHPKFDVLVDESKPGQNKVFDFRLKRWLDLKGKIVHVPSEQEPSETTIWTQDEGGSLWKETFLSSGNPIAPLNYQGVFSNNAQNAIVAVWNATQVPSTRYMLYSDANPEGVELNVTRGDFPQVTWDGTHFVFFNPDTKRVAFVDPKKPQEIEFVSPQSPEVKGPKGSPKDKTLPRDAVITHKLNARGQVVDIATGEIVKDIEGVKKITALGKGYYFIQGDGMKASPGAMTFQATNPNVVILIKEGDGKREKAWVYDRVEKLDKGRYVFFFRASIAVFDPKAKEGEEFKDISENMLSDARRFGGVTRDGKYLVTSNMALENIDWSQDSEWKLNYTNTETGEKQFMFYDEALANQIGVKRARLHPTAPILLMYDENNKIVFAVDVRNNHALKGRFMGTDRTGTNAFVVDQDGKGINIYKGDGQYETAPIEKGLYISKVAFGREKNAQPGTHTVLVNTGRWWKFVFNEKGERVDWQPADSPDAVFESYTEMDKSGEYVVVSKESKPVFYGLLFEGDFQEVVYQHPLHDITVIDPSQGERTVAVDEKNGNVFEFVGDIIQSVPTAVPQRTVLMTKRYDGIHSFVSRDGEGSEFNETFNRQLQRPKESVNPGVVDDERNPRFMAREENNLYFISDIANDSQEIARVDAKYFTQVQFDGDVFVFSNPDHDRVLYLDPHDPENPIEAVVGAGVAGEDRGNGVTDKPESYQNLSSEFVVLNAQEGKKKVQSVKNPEQATNWGGNQFSVRMTDKVYLVTKKGGAEGENVYADALYFVDGANVGTDVKSDSGIRDMRVLDIRNGLMVLKNITRDEQFIVNANLMTGDPLEHGNMYVDLPPEEKVTKVTLSPKARFSIHETDNGDIYYYDHIKPTNGFKKIGNRISIKDFYFNQNDGLLVLKDVASGEKSVYDLDKRDFLRVKKGKIFQGKEIAFDHTGKFAIAKQSNGTLHWINLDTRAFYDQSETTNIYTAQDEKRVYFYFSRGPDAGTVLSYEKDDAGRIKSDKDSQKTFGELAWFIDEYTADDGRLNLPQLWQHLGSNTMTMAGIVSADGKMKFKNLRMDELAYSELKAVEQMVTADSRIELYKERGTVLMYDFRGTKIEARFFGFNLRLATLKGGKVPYLLRRNIPDGPSQVSAVLTLKNRVNLLKGAVSETARPKVDIGFVDSTNRFILYQKAGGSEVSLVDSEGQSYDVTSIIPKGFELQDVNGEAFVLYNRDTKQVRYFHPNTYLEYLKRPEEEAQEEEDLGGEEIDGEEMTDEDLLAIEEAVRFWNDQVLGPKGASTQSQKAAQFGVRHWVEQIHQAYEPLLKRLEDANDDQITEDIRRELKKELNAFYQNQEAEVRNRYEEAVKQGKNELDYEDLPFAKFLGRVTEVEEILNEKQDGQQRTLFEEFTETIRQERDATTRQRMLRSLFEAILLLETKTDLLSFGTDLKEDDLAKNILRFSLFGWKPRNAEQISKDTFDSLSNLVKELQGKLHVSNDVLFKIVSFLSSASGRNEEDARVTIGQVNKMLKLRLTNREVSDQYLKRWMKSFGSVSESRLVKSIEDGRLRDQIGEAGRMVRFLTNSVPITHSREYIEPEGIDRIDDEKGIYFDQLNDAFSNGEFKTMQELIAKFFEIKNGDRNEQVAQDLRQKVNNLKERMGEKAELTQNSKDAGAKHLDVEYYIDEARREFIEEATDDGPGPVFPLALFLLKSMKSDQLQLGEMVGRYGSGKMTFFMDVDRVEFIFNNGKEAFLVVLNVDRTTNDIRMTRIKELDAKKDLEEGKKIGVRVRRIKKMANCIPELDQMIGQTAWKIFSGMSNDKNFELSFLEMKNGKKERRKVEVKGLKKLVEGDVVVAEKEQDGKIVQVKKKMVVWETDDPDLEPQIIDRNGNRVDEIRIKIKKEKDKEQEVQEATKEGELGEVDLFELVPNFLKHNPERKSRHHIDDLGLVFQLPWPISENRNSFEDQTDPKVLSRMQKAIAIYYYKALVYKELTRSDNSFTLDDYSHDWETAPDKNNRFLRLLQDPANKPLFDLVARINKGDVDEIGFEEMESLKTRLDEMHTLQIPEGFMKFIVGVEARTVDGNIGSLILRRMKTQEDLNPTQVDQWRGALGSTELNVSRASTAAMSDPFAGFRSRIASQLSESKKVRVEDLVIPETEYNLSHKQLVEHVQKIGQAVGFNNIILVKSAYPFPASFRGDGTIFVNEKLAHQLDIGGAGMGGVNIHQPTETMIHELAHFFEHLYELYLMNRKMSELEVYEAPTFTHQAKGRFGTFYRLVATIALAKHDLDEIVIDDDGAFESDGRPLTMRGLMDATLGGTEGKVGRDTGAFGKAKDVGGIDFNPRNMNINIKRRGPEVPVPVDLNNMNPADLRIEGLTPVIINITPIQNLYLLLGVAEDERIEKLSQLY